MPALGLPAVSGRRAEIFSVAQEFERVGFSGIWVPSMAADAFGFLLSLAYATAEIELGTGVQPIYARPAGDTAAIASYVADVAGPRFRLGLGVGHVPLLEARGLPHGSRPLGDMRAYIDGVRAAWPEGSEPRIVMAALRNRMLDLAIEQTEGVIWAQGALSGMPGALDRVPENRRAGFRAWNQMATVIDSDPKAALERCRRVLTMYTRLPNYREYWRSVGYEDEVTAMEKAALTGDDDAARAAMSEAWVRDITLVGTPTQVRDRIDAWFDVGVTPIIFPSATTGGQMKALSELLALYDGR